MTIDPGTRDRLEQLRATDVTGIHASDQPTEGTDPGAAVTVTVDPTLRITAVRVRDVDAVRSPDAVTSAFEAAYRAALILRLRPHDDGGAAGRSRPVARRVRRVNPAPTAERLARHRSRHGDPERPRDRRLGEVTGTSANRYVSVRLPVANPRGHLDVDPTWLAVTTRARLGRAITEAYADAYTRRDEQ